MSQEIPQPSITKIIFKLTQEELHLNLPVVNELNIRPPNESSWNGNFLLLGKTLNECMLSIQIMQSKN